MTKKECGTQTYTSIEVNSRSGPQPDNGLDAQRLRHAADFGASFIISGILAVTFRTMTAPLERVKLILQTQASSHQIAHSDRTAYRGITNAFIRIPKEQGFFSLWRGNLINICRYFPAQAINFSFFDLYYEIFEQVIESRTAHTHDILPFLAGGAVGFTSCTLLYPLSFCNTRITVDIGDSKEIKREFHGLHDCMYKVYKSDGYRGFYQGLTFASTGLTIYRGIYFGVYTLGKRTYLGISGQDNHTLHAPFMVSLSLAISASAIATYMSYPLDTLSRQKMLFSGRGVHNYVPVKKLIGNIMKKDGLRGFYKGVNANLLTTLCGSLLLATYDIIRGLYDTMKESKASKSDA
ncbi:ADP/ATP translocase 3-like [Ceratina calcarata]|uniref:ADP/ATP translocase n=1 Tax=Ceratina calcarata TaxID=156304 RepID=A0AAJ7IVD9_9HYME|nr:ADP/ATP translocase 3-like [Ceratina calcarata]